MIHYVYMLKCADNTFYTGYTNDPAHRIRMHNSGKGSKYTRSRLPVKYIYISSFANRSAALREEYKIKQLTRQQKKKLITSKKNEIGDFR